MNYEQAESILRGMRQVLQPKVTDFDSVDETDYIGTETGLCKIRVRASIYSTQYWIGPVWGKDNQVLKGEKLFESRFFEQAVSHLVDYIKL